MVSVLQNLLKKINNEVCAYFQQGEDESESERGWLAEEEDRILHLREATQELQNEVERREEAVKQRERMHKEKLRLQTSRTSDEVSQIQIVVLNTA